MKNEIAKDMKTESRIEDLFQSLKSHEISIKNDDGSNISQDRIRHHRDIFR